MSDKNTVNAERIWEYQRVLMLQASASKKYGEMFVIGYFWPSLIDTRAQFKH